MPARLGLSPVRLLAEVGFPAVHDMPAPRADTPLTPDQVKQATDDLIIAARTPAVRMPPPVGRRTTPAHAQKTSLQAAGRRRAGAADLLVQNDAKQ